MGETFPDRSDYDDPRAWYDHDSAAYRRLPRTVFDLTLGESNGNKVASSDRVTDQTPEPDDKGGN